jgi:hypothetical protein
MGCKRAFRKEKAYLKTFAICPRSNHKMPGLFSEKLEIMIWKF